MVAWSVAEGDYRDDITAIVMLLPPTPPLPFAPDVVRQCIAVASDASAHNLAKVCRLARDCIQAPQIQCRLACHARVLAAKMRCDSPPARAHHGLAMRHTSNTHVKIDLIWFSIGYNVLCTYVISDWIGRIGLALARGSALRNALEGGRRCAAGNAPRVATLPI
eukprot:2723279-Pleurochrysis_carterae.AAC.1